MNLRIDIEEANRAATLRQLTKEYAHLANRMLTHPIPNTSKWTIVINKFHWLSKRTKNTAESRCRWMCIFLQFAEALMKLDMGSLELKPLCEATYLQCDQIHGAIQRLRSSLSERVCGDLYLHLYKFQSVYADTYEIA